jgi:hypothetical protein
MKVSACRNPVGSGPDACSTAQGYAAISDGLSNDPAVQGGKNHTTFL